MPSDTSQAESCVSPPRALVQTKGEPLSHWIARAVPCSWKSCSRTPRTSAPRAPGKSVTASTKRLWASRTVNGSHFCPLPARHQPLKSMVHKSSAPETSTRGTTVNSPDAHRRPAPPHFAEPAQDAHHRAPARSVRSESALEHPGDLV